MDYKKLTWSFFKGWLMAFGAIMAIYAAFVAVWLKCKAFRSWFTSKLIEATWGDVDDSLESFNEELKAL